MLHVSEDGESSRAPQSIYIDSKDPVEFVILLPEYVVNALGCAVQVRHVQAVAVIKLFEERMEQYRDWAYTKKAEPVIMLTTKLFSRDRSEAWTDRGPSSRSDISHDSFFIESNRSGSKCEHQVAVSVSYALLFRVNGHLHFRVKDPNNASNYVPGHRLSHVEGVVLDYTPELHARLSRICEALHDAAHTLHEIIQSKDIPAALMAATSLRIAGPRALTKETDNV